nr:glycosyltransferase [Thermoanaerobaculia bacterium]
MKILLYSPAFLPSVGGLELGVASLARELGSLGHAVVVMTETPGSWHEPLPFAVIRRPSRRSSLAWMRWCEVFFQANVSLRGLWPLLLVPRPWAVSHHSWYCQVNGRIALRDRLKRGLLRLACCSVAVSEAMARELATTWPRHRPQVIPNSYRSETFRLLPEVAREKELIFVGRLVSDKGADFLLEALALLAEEGLRPRLTIVGEGPEKAPLEAQVSRLGLISQLTFIGLVTGSALARELNA